MDVFDFIIVGAGASGSVLANRLSANPSRNVLLIEAGKDVVPGAEPADILDTFPSSVANPDYKWPDLRVHWGREGDSPPSFFDQGRIFGGSASLMGMIALRGTPDDYDEWERAGARGWGWSDVLPYFRKLETDFDFHDDLHGTDGPIPVRRHAREQWPPLARASAAYAARHRWPVVADMNGDFRPGFCSVPMASSMTKRGSSAICYLTAEVRRRPNLRVLASAHVTKLLAEGRRITGVEVSVAGSLQVFKAQETIVTAGAVHTPVILMRSGIGPAASLKDAGVEVLADRAGVGANLQNHAAIWFAALLRPSAAQPKALRPLPNTCLRFSSGVPGPDVDMIVMFQNRSSWHKLGSRIGFAVPNLLKPESRGRIALRSENAAAAPLIEFALLSATSDMDRMVAGSKRAIDFLLSPEFRPLTPKVFPLQVTDRLRRLNRKTRLNALGSYILASILDPCPWLADVALDPLLGSSEVDLQTLAHDDDALRTYLRANVTGLAHPAGTCRMGLPEDLAAVVDPAGKVYGCAGLRVGDASIMPTLMRGNTFIPTVMAAEKVANDALIAA